ncbi:MAG: hypothetical protein HIU92_17005, partial [Proteobacteria bacterium]|nr:hypothetical protein [Pseudomonadota bacterium]
MSTTVLRASTFIDTLGVNTHIPYTDGGYANIGNVTADLSYLGIHQVRDQISNGASGSAPLSSYITVAKTGVHFTVNLSGGTIADLQSTLVLADQLNQAVPGSVIAVEGANEINNWPVSFNGVGGLQGAINMQAAIYGLVHSDPNLKGVAVDYFTGNGNGGLAMGPDPSKTPGLADYDTQHPYPNNGNPPAGWVSRAQALPNETSSTAPAVYTETGYSTNGGTSGGVNQDVQAKYTLDLLMDDAKNGIAHTDLYQLMDPYAAGSPQGNDGFGLFAYGNQPKEAATAIHNLTTILADTGSTAGSFSTTAAAYSITGMPSAGNSMEIEKSNGASDIVVWNEPAIWNESTGTETTASTQNVTVNLGATYQTVEVFDPLSGTAPVQTLSNVSSVSLGLTDHPLIIETEPQSTTTPVTPPVTTPPVTTPPVTTPPGTTGGGGSSPDTLTLNVSGDHWKSDAQFIVKVNGQQAGGTYDASALHSSGDAGTVQLSGNWGSGVQDVQVSFINDAYGGSASTDRNLYVNSIAYDGTTYAN